MAVRLFLCWAVMGAVFVIGHGGYWEGSDDEEPGGMWTRVPEGMTVHLYAAPGEGILPMNALQILLENGSRGSLESVPAGERILNYCFSPLEDDAWMQMLGGIQPDQWALFIGRDELAGIDRLCLTSGACSTVDHPCGGLFSVLAEASEVHLLTCRSGPLAPGETPAQAAASGAYPNTEYLPGEEPAHPVHFERIQDLALRILEFAGQTDSGFADPDNAEAGSLFDGLDEADRVKLMAVQEVRAWSHVRYARALLRHYDTDLAGFATWFDSQDPLDQGWYRADELLAGALAKTGR
jgi:hypothetical protein